MFNSFSLNLSLSLSIYFQQYSVVNYLFYLLLYCVATMLVILIAGLYFLLSKQKNIDFTSLWMFFFYSLTMRRSARAVAFNFRYFVVNSPNVYVLFFFLW